MWCFVVMRWIQRYLFVVGENNSFIFLDKLRNEVREHLLHGKREQKSIKPANVNYVLTGMKGKSYHCLTLVSMFLQPCAKYPFLRGVTQQIRSAEITRFLSSRIRWISLKFTWTKRLTAIVWCNEKMISSPDAVLFATCFCPDSDCSNWFCAPM